MAIEAVTANVALTKITFETNDDLWDLWSQRLLPDGWVGGIMNAKDVNGQASSECAVSATSPDGQVLAVRLNVTVVTVINNVYAAMTPDEYTARYGDGA